MLVIIPYWSGDSDRAEALARLIVSYELNRREDIWFMPAPRQDCKINPRIEELLKTRFRVVPFQCNSPMRGYPGGANGCFASSMLHVATWMKEIQLVFWLESDAFPMVPNWIDRLLAAWAGRKPGKMVLGHRFSIDGTLSTEHVNGVALYDPKIVSVVEGITACQSVGWDYYCKSKVRPHADDTPEIRYTHNRRNFEQWEFPANPPAILHGVKDDSLLNVLWKRLTRV